MDDDEVEETDFIEEGSLWSCFRGSFEAPEALQCRGQDVDEVSDVYDVLDNSPQEGVHEALEPEDEEIATWHESFLKT